MSVILDLVAEMQTATEAAKALASGMTSAAREARAAKEAFVAAEAAKTTSAESSSGRSEVTTPGGRVPSATGSALGAVTNAVIQSEGRRT